METLVLLAILGIGIAAFVVGFVCGFYISILGMKNLIDKGEIKIVKKNEPDA